jgi:hypothetical protein
MQYLKQSTAATVVIGAFVDATDGFTPETGLTAGGVDDLVVSKNGGSAVDISSNTFTAKTNTNGCYDLSLTASDTDTLGRLDVYVRDDSVCRPVLSRFQVVPANVYDSLFSTDFLQVDVVQISSSTAAADNLEQGAKGIVTGTVGTGSTTTSVVTGLTETTNDHYNGRTVTFVSGNLAGQSATISDYTGSTGTLTVTTLTEAPANGDLFVIV